MNKRINIIRIKRTEAKPRVAVKWNPAETVLPTCRYLGPCSSCIFVSWYGIWWSRYFIQVRCVFIKCEIISESFQFWRQTQSIHKHIHTWAKHMKYDFVAQNSLNMKTYLLKFTCMQVLNKMFQQKLTWKGFWISVVNIHKIPTTSERLFWWDRKSVV